MKAALFRSILLAAIAVTPARPQFAACQRAVTDLNRIKEWITPGLSTQSSGGAYRLRLMQSILSDAAAACPSKAEVWYYLTLVSDHLGDKRSAAEAQRQLDLLPPEDRSDPFAPLAPDDGPDNGRIRHKWALVVGINTFQSDQLPSLGFAVKDSEDFAAFLLDPDGGRFDAHRVRKLANEHANLKEIREGIGWLRVNAQPGDLVVVYIASHGSPRSADPNGVSYILTHDTDLRNSETLYATSLQMIDLVQTLNREIKARRIALFLDTCYSGDAQRAVSDGSRGFKRVWDSAPPPADAPASTAFSAALENFKFARGHAVITASRADEQSFEGQPFDNGYFTHFLMLGLQQDHGVRPLSALFHEIREEVSAAVRSQHPGHTQTPSFEFSDQADSIVLGAPEFAGNLK
ncbi:MAG TPA: caspase family protein [Bryobacteraceae bacterium]|jgi:uncharacterized caspase-like protein|nr:caspase family protein [Bryobacteraceae bacterium]